jgi:hypothetical protein
LAFYCLVGIFGQDWVAMARNPYVDFILIQMNFLHTSRLLDVSAESLDLGEFLDLCTKPNQVNISTESTSRTMLITIKPMNVSLHCLTQRLESLISWIEDVASTAREAVPFRRTWSLCTFIHPEIQIV